MSKEQLTELLHELAWPLAAAALALVVTLIFLVPKLGQILSLRREINQQNQEIKQLQQKLADLNTLSEAELFESSSLLEEALPPEPDLFKNMIILRKTFEENGVTLDSFRLLGGLASGSAGPAGQVAGLSTLRMEVAFSAPFESFRQMIKAMEKILPLTAVKRIKFGSLEATESGSLAGLAGKAEVISFFSPLPKTLGKAEQPLPKITNQEQKLIEELKLYTRYQAGVSVEELISSPSAVGRDNPFSI